MLDIIRKKKESVIVKIVFVLIVLSFIGTMYLVWGEGDSGGPSRSGGYAAKVDGKTIPLEEYQSAYQRMRGMYQQIYGANLTPEIEKMLGLKKIALDALVDNMLVMKAAKGMSIKVSKEDVSNAISAMTMFQKDGAFSFEQYQQLLKSNRMTAKDFEESQKTELILKKARQSIKDKAVVSDEDALAQFKKENEKIDLEYACFAPADLINEVKLADKDLTEYLQKNQDQFKTAEKVAISFIRFDPATLSAVTVTEDDVQNFYQKNIDRYQGKDGSIPYKEARDRVFQDALRQKAAKQGYEYVADTLFKDIKSGDLNLIAGKLKLKPQTTELFAAATPPEALAGEAAVVKKAFELKDGELGGPVETAKGIYVIKLKEKKPSAVPPLAEIRAAVEQKAKIIKSAELVIKKADDTAYLLSTKGATKTVPTGSFGYSPKGDIPGIGNAPEIMEAAFKLTSAAPAPSTPFKIASRWCAIKLKSRTEAPKTEFDKTKDALKKQMLPKKQDEALEAWLKELRSKAKIELNQSLIAEK